MIADYLGRVHVAALPKQQPGEEKRVFQIYSIATRGQSLFLFVLFFPVPFLGTVGIVLQGVELVADGDQDLGRLCIYI